MPARLFPNEGVWTIEMGDYSKRAFIEHPVVGVDYVGRLFEHVADKLAIQL